MYPSRLIVSPWRTFVVSIVILSILGWSRTANSACHLLVNSQHSSVKGQYMLTRSIVNNRPTYADVTEERFIFHTFDFTTKQGRWVISSRFQNASESTVLGCIRSWSPSPASISLLSSNAKWQVLENGRLTEDLSLKVLCHAPEHTVYWASSRIPKLNGFYVETGKKTINNENVYVRLDSFLDQPLNVISTGVDYRRKGAESPSNAKGRPVYFLYSLKMVKGRKNYRRWMISEQVDSWNGLAWIDVYHHADVPTKIEQFILYERNLARAINSSLPRTLNWQVFDNQQWTDDKSAIIVGGTSDKSVYEVYRERSLRYPPMPFTMPVTGRGRLPRIGIKFPSAVSQRSQQSLERLLLAGYYMLDLPPESRSLLQHTDIDLYPLRSFYFVASLSATLFGSSLQSLETALQSVLADGVLDLMLLSDICLNSNCEYPFETTWNTAQKLFEEGVLINIGLANVGWTDMRTLVSNGLIPHVIRVSFEDISSFDLQLLQECHALNVSLQVETKKPMSAAMQRWLIQQGVSLLVDVSHTNPVSRMQSIFCRRLSAEDMTHFHPQSISLYEEAAEIRDCQMYARSSMHLKAVDAWLVVLLRALVIGLSVAIVIWIALNIVGYSVFYDSNKLN